MVFSTFLKCHFSFPLSFVQVKIHSDKEQYISRVFQTTSPNITINGLSPNPDLITSMLAASETTRSIEEHEPFNPKLWERAKELARQEEDLIEEIAALRRKMPGIAVEGAKSGFKEGMEMDEKVLSERLEAVKERVGSEGGLGVGRMERQEDVESAWERGVQGLGRLKRTIPEMVARKEKTERVEQYVLKMT
jgi:kinetochor protein Mis14/NSL1